MQILEYDYDDVYSQRHDQENTKEEDGVGTKHDSMNEVNHFEPDPQVKSTARHPRYCCRACYPACCYGANNEAYRYVRSNP